MKELRLHDALETFSANKNNSTPANIIDLDSGLQKKTIWKVPDVIKKYSLNEAVSLPRDVYKTSDRVARYLLVSKDRAVTLFHTDFTGTSVFYAVLKGTKVFHLVRPTSENCRLFQGFLKLRNRRGLYFGSHPNLEGGCQKVSVVARQAIVMPAGVIHCVETHGDSVALG